jgi:hypothetical protein
MVVAGTEGRRMQDPSSSLNDASNQHAGHVIEVSNV